MAGIVERDDSVLQSATTDITGLPGKKEFYQSALKEAREKSEGGDFTAFCPCFFNVTNFRAYNRNCGIEGGDRALVYIAKTLKEEFPGALIGHFTADHFAGILPREDLFDKIREVADKVDSYFANGVSLCGINGPMPHISGENSSMNFKSFASAAVVCIGEPTMNPQPT